jgi:hypothetical protein
VIEEILTGAVSTIVSGLGGGLLRFAPEVLGYFDKQNERAHELALQDKQIKLAELQQAGKLREITAQTEGQAKVADLQAFSDALRSQFQQVGVKWVDALSALVRPITTYYVMAMWGMKKTAEIAIAMHHDGALQALVSTWTSADQAMLVGILSFWFVGRVFEKK